MLIIFSGLSGTGKTTLARALAQRLGAVYLRADTIEQALREGGMEQIDDRGYRVGYRVASENLRLGSTVIADSVNPWPLTRRAWRDAAERAGAKYLDVEVVCSDVAEHRRRVEARRADIEGFELPDWESVICRDYRDWDEPVLRVDTAEMSVDEAVALIIRAISGDERADAASIG